MKQIPKRFTMGPDLWRVEIGPLPSNTYGNCQWPECVIRIASEHDGVPIEPRHQLRTFIHEAIHAALYTLGHTAEPHDERLVQGLENMLWQMLSTARYE